MAAVCPPDYNWARNNQNYDPCELASLLLDKCSHADSFHLPVIQDGKPYQRTAQDICSCSSPVYALVSACDDCQHVSFPSWTEWSAGCSKTYTQSQVPPSLQNELHIPQWAITYAIPSYDPDKARSSVLAAAGSTPDSPTSATAATTTTSDVSPAVTDSPSSTSPTPDASAAGTSSNVTPNSTTVTPASDSQSASTSGTDGGTPSTAGLNAAYSSDSPSVTAGSAQSSGQPSGSNSNANSILSASNKSSNKGAIAGGTIGALLFIAIAAAIAFRWYIYRRRARMAPSAMYKATYGSHPPTSITSRAFGERSNTTVAALVHNNSSSNVLYHDEESHSDTPLVSYAGPRYSHVPHDSASEPSEAH